MSRATGQPSYFFPSRLTPSQAAPLTDVVRGVPLDTVVVVREADDATGPPPEFLPAALEDLAETAHEGVGGVGGKGHRGVRWWG